MRQFQIPARLRRIFRPLLIVPLLAIVTLGSWGLASPVGSSPDDDFHLTSIWCDKPNECSPGSNANTRLVPSALLTNAVCYAAKPDESARCQGANFGQGKLARGETSRGNFDGLYPPVFYAAMSVFVGANVETSVLLMRLANILLFVGLMTAVFALSPPWRRPTVVWTSAITMVPLGMFLIPSTNPSSWAITSAAVLTISLISFFESAGWRKVLLGVTAVVATIVGAGARADAAVYACLAIVCVLLLTVRRNREFFVSLLLPIGLGGICLFFWFAARQAEASTSGLGSGGGVSANPKHLFIYNFLNVPDLWVGAFGKWSLGWFDTVLPSAVWVGTFGIFCAAIFFGFTVKVPRKGIASALVLGAVWLIPTVILVQTNAVVGGYVQPRYIYPLIIMFATIALLQTRTAQLSLSNWQTVIVISVLAAANALSLHTNIRRYVTGTDQNGVNLDRGAEWWWNIPLSPMTVWIIGSLAFTLLLVVIAIPVKKAVLKYESQSLNQHGANNAV